MIADHFSPLAASLFSLLAIGSLLLAFVFLGSRWLNHYVLAFAAESWLIAALSASIAYYDGLPELYIVAALTIMFRGVVLPWLLLRIIARLSTARESNTGLQPGTSLLLGALSVVFAVVVANRMHGELGSGRNVVVLALTVMLSMKLIGFLVLATRREAVSEVMGLLLLENGIFLGAQILVPGMPLLIEIVILFDLLIAVACFGLLVRYLVRHTGTTSTAGLRRLVG